MSAYAEQLFALQNAMIAGERTPMLPLIKQARHNEFPPEARLSVYTEGYEIRLFEAVKEDFPALEYYLGEEIFAEILNQYIRKNPSVFWDLAMYSVPFAEFFLIWECSPNPTLPPSLRLRTTGRASPCSVGESDVNAEAVYALATLEASIIEVFWMPESAPWQPDSATAPEALMDQNIALRAAAKLLQLSHPVEEYLAAFRRDDPIEMPAASTQHMLLVRHENEVKRYVISAEEFAALTVLQQGKKLSEALEAAPDIATAQKWFSKWMAHGFLRA